MQNHATGGAFASRHRNGALLSILIACTGALGASTMSTNRQDVDGGQHADLVVLNAAIWTGQKHVAKEAKSANEATALAIHDGKIVAIGSDAAIRSQIGPGTTLIDAGGRRVMPGMTDSHTHIVGGGLQLDRLALRDVKNRREFVEAVEAAAKAKGNGQWLQGGRWSVESWSDSRSPDRSWLDPVTRHVAVFLTRMDGHQAVVNSNALRLAHIDAAGPEDPPGGEIERDPKTGEPTGILKESAMELVRRLIPELTTSQRYEALRCAMKHANALGITSVHDMSELADLEAFRHAHKAGTLTLRITAYLSVDDWTAHWKDAEGFAVTDDMLRVAGFKGFMDGSLGSRTAYMREPYSDITLDEPYPRGQLTAQAAAAERFRKHVLEADARGFQLAVHAIGDEANHLVLNAYAATRRKSGGPPTLHRVEHAQHLRPSDIPRFAELGVVASMQPFHKADDGRYAEAAIGSQRLRGSYAFRQLVDAGALLCFGSDWPVVTLNPFAGVDSAVNARTIEGKVWLAPHSLTLEEALRAYTASPPRAIGRSDRLGTLEVGKLADILILENDPFTMPIALIADVKVRQTIVNGKVVYSAGRD